MLALLDFILTLASRFQSVRRASLIKATGIRARHAYTRVRDHLLIINGIPSRHQEYARIRGADVGRSVTYPPKEFDSHRYH